jgi:hypothetical protein
LIDFDLEHIIPRLNSRIDIDNRRKVVLLSKMISMRKWDWLLPIPKSGIGNLTPAEMCGIKV